MIEAAHDGEADGEAGGPAGEDHDEGECKVRIQETDGDDLGSSREK